MAMRGGIWNLLGQGCVNRTTRAAHTLATGSVHGVFPELHNHLLGIVYICNFFLQSTTQATTITTITTVTTTRRLSQIAFVCEEICCYGGSGNMFVSVQCSECQSDEISNKRG